jgi:hypothetical protein
LIGISLISDEKTAQVGSVGVDRAGYVGVACLVIAAVMAAIALLSHPSPRTRWVAGIAFVLAVLSMAWPVIWFVAAALVSCGAGNCL